MVSKSSDIQPGTVVVIAGVTLSGMSTVILGLRYYCRYFRMGSVAWYDHFMLIALLITWGNTVTNYYQNEFGMQYKPSHLRFPEERPALEIALTGTLVTWFTYRITYVLALCFVKLSILTFYRAIATHKIFRRAVYSTMAFVCMYTFSMIMACVFQCENPSQAWSTKQFFSQFDDGKPGRPRLPRTKCSSPTMLYIVSAALNLFTDVIILLLPIPTLLALRVPMNKRLALIGIFSIGIMAIIASCIRMWVIALWSESVSNSQHFGPDLLLWGQVETNSAIISASIPFLRMLFRSSNDGPSQEKLPPPRRIEPPASKPAELASLKIFEGPEKGPNGSPIWKPFITVPANLSSKDSTMVNSTRPHSMV